MIRVNTGYDASCPAMVGRSTRRPDLVVPHEEGSDMGIGLGVFLILVGAVMSFSTVDTQYLNTNLNAVGYIFMIGGVLVMVIGTIQNRQRFNPRTRDSRVERRTRTIQDPTDPSKDRQVIEERRVDDL